MNSYSLNDERKEHPMGLAVWALIAYIAVIVIWSVALKRGIGEAMVVGFLVVCAFGGSDFLRLVLVGMQAAFDQEIVFAALAFTFIGFLLASTGVIDRQVDLLNSPRPPPRRSGLRRDRRLRSSARSRTPARPTRRPWARSRSRG